MSTIITCPNCAAQFEPSDAIAQSIEREMRQKMEQEWRKRLESLNGEKQQLELLQKEIAQKQAKQEEELAKRLSIAAAEQEAKIKQDLGAKLKADFEHQIRAISEAKAATDEQLKVHRQREVEFLKKEQAMEELKNKMELDTQRQLMEERKKIAEELRMREDERYKLREQDHQMKIKEMEMQLEAQRKLAEEALRKAEQGSMQLQGEVQEIALEALLRQSFPFDSITEIAKGTLGADCILTVRNNSGQECGTIIFESKRTKAFSTDWIDKLKNDSIKINADISVLVTQAMPKDMEQFGEKQGVYLCSFADVKSLVAVLRQAIIRVYDAKKSQENKGDKMVLLYDYLTGTEFLGQWNAMREGFQAFRNALQKERDDFEKNWKKKQKLLELIINNSLQISGSIEGISGLEEMAWNSLPDGSDKLLE